MGITATRVRLTDNGSKPQNSRSGAVFVTDRGPGLITGFNTDVKYRGVVYHVQTEDKGTANPMIETLIYKGGEILGSRRLPYADLVKRGDEPAITRLMEDQHKGMLLEVKRGRFDPGGDRTVMEDLSLDEIVLAYLASRVAAK
jgi:hypothetical protein